MWHESVEAGSDFVQVVGEQPGIDVESHCGRRMAQHPLDGLHIRPDRDRK
jgi:hypothetical protein